jgi:hypothetical protein
MFRYDRVVRADSARSPGDWQPFYEGHVTLSAADRRPVINMTYDYNLGVPNAAPASLSQLPVVRGAFLLGIAAAIVAVTRRRTVRRQ